MERKHPIKTTGDPYLDMLAEAWSVMFTQAQTSLTARAEIVEFFGLERVRDLYRAGVIPWNHESDRQPQLMEV